MSARISANDNGPANEEIDIYSREYVKEVVKHISAVKKELKSIQSSFYKIGSHLFWLNSNQAYKAYGCKNIIEFAENEFGLKKTTVYDFLSIIERFGEISSEDESVINISDKFKDYSPTKLIQMKSLTDEEIDNNITPAMTVKEIKAKRKELESFYEENNDNEDSEIVIDECHDENITFDNAIMKINSLEELESGIKDLMEMAKKYFSGSDKNKTLTIDYEFKY